MFRKFSALLIFVFFFSHCDFKEIGTNEDKSMEGLQTQVEVADTIVGQDSSSHDNKCPLIKDYLLDIGYSYLLESSMDKVTRSATLECFIKLYEQDFNQLAVEKIIVLKKGGNESKPVYMKRLEFKNESSAELIYDAYAKGFHQSCLGIKEPHFLTLKNTEVYVFYVLAERDREMLKGLQSIMLDSLGKCKNYVFKTF